MVSVNIHTLTHTMVNNSINHQINPSNYIQFHHNMSQGHLYMSIYVLIYVNNK